MPPSTFKAGDAVQTPLGKGIVREARKNGRLLVEVSGRAVLIDARTASPVTAARRARPADAPGVAAATSRPAVARQVPGEVDLHGLTVEEALARAEQAINDALLADRPDVRLIHGRRGGRIRAALHRLLKDIPSVRAFRLDPGNAGVTIVTF